MPRVRAQLSAGLGAAAAAGAELGSHGFFPRTLARYVHTLRNLPEMVRNMDHIVNRFDEAATYGYLHAPMAAGWASTSRVRAWPHTTLARRGHHALERGHQARVRVRVRVRVGAKPGLGGLG